MHVALETEYVNTKTSQCVFESLHMCSSLHRRFPLSLRTCVCVCVCLHLCLCTHEALALIKHFPPNERQVFLHRLCMLSVCSCLHAANTHSHMMHRGDLSVLSTNKVHVRWVWGVFALFGWKSKDLANAAFDVEMNDSNSLGTVLSFYARSPNSFLFLCLCSCFGRMPTVEIHLLVQSSCIKCLF